jgi:hypothetical protein
VRQALRFAQDYVSLVPFATLDGATAVVAATKYWLTYQLVSSKQPSTVRGSTTPLENMAIWLARF